MASGSRVEIVEKLEIVKKLEKSLDKSVDQSGWLSELGSAANYLKISG